MKYSPKVFWTLRYGVTRESEWLKPRTAVEKTWNSLIPYPTLALVHTALVARWCGMVLKIRSESKNRSISSIFRYYKGFHCIPSFYWESNGLHGLRHPSVRPSVPPCFSPPFPPVFVIIHFCYVIHFCFFLQAGFVVDNIELVPQSVVLPAGTGMKGVLSTFAQAFLSSLPQDPSCAREKILFAAEYQSVSMLLPPP